MADLIDRQAAIDATCMEWCGVKHQDCEHPFDIEKDDYYWCDGCETALQTLPELPSAQPERKTGQWQEDPNGYGFWGYGFWICSACGFVLKVSGTDLLYNFCPNCGADMRKEKQDATD